MLLRFYHWVFGDQVRANQLLGVVRFGTAFLLSILLVKSYLSNSEVGILEYMIFLGVNFSFFITNAFSNSALSVIPKHSEEKQASLFTNLLVGNVLFAIVISAIIFFGLPHLLNWLERPDLISQAPWITLLAFIMMLGNWADIFYLTRQKSYQLGWYGVLVYGLKFILIAIGIYLNFTIWTLLKLYIVWEAAKMLWGFICISNERAKISIPVLKEMIFVTSPLFLHFLLGKGIEFINGNLVIYFLSSEQFAFYQYGAKEIPVSPLFLMSMTAAMIPLLSKDISKYTFDLKQRIKNLLPTLSLITIAFLFLSPYLFVWFYDDSYILSAKIFNIMTLLLISRFVTAYVFFYAKGDNSLLMYMTGIELVINFIISYTLLQTIGVIGVPIAIVISNAVYVSIGVVVVFKRYGIGLSEYLPIKQYTFWMGAVLVSFFIVNFLFL